MEAEIILDLKIKRIILLWRIWFRKSENVFLKKVKSIP